MADLKKTSLAKLLKRQQELTQRIGAAIEELRSLSHDSSREGRNDWHMQCIVCTDLRKELTQVESEIAARVARA